MQLLLTDETNQRPGRDVRFFIFGGLVVPLEHLDRLHDRVAAARAQANYEARDELKFETNARPARVTVEQATQAKRQVIAAARECNCRFIAHVIHHSVIQNQDLEQQVQWAADYVLGRFNQYLTEKRDTGICAVDNLPGGTQFRYLSDKFSSGLTLQDGSQIRLDRIRLLSATCSNASHVSSVMDIVLGAFRYCMNNPRNREAATEMMREVVALIWHDRQDGRLRADGRGLILRPELERIRRADYRHEYEEMIAHLNGLLE